jgi:hypothetical protein
VVESARVRVAPERACGVEVVDPHMHARHVLARLLGHHQPLRPCLHAERALDSRRWPVAAQEQLALRLHRKRLGKHRAVVEATGEVNGCASVADSLVEIRSEKEQGPREAELGCCVHRDIATGFV